MNHAYPNPIDNPALIRDFVWLASEDLNLLDLEMVVGDLQSHGYEAKVREGRLETPGMSVGEVKFAGDQDTGNIVGIDTSHGHRWTISEVPQGYKLVDHKLGVTGVYRSALEAKGAALRAQAHETDKTSVDPYGEESNARPMYEDEPTLSVDKLRTLFPNHYLTK